jgi:hypothetical protein
MTLKAPQTREALEAHLAEQRAFLEASAASFDMGFEGEAKRLAVVVRILVHDTKSSHSLMGQLGIKDRPFLDTSFDIDPKNLASHGGLVAVALGPPNTRYVAMLDDAPSRKEVSFEEWWNKPVFLDRDRSVLTRREVVLIAANQDGGAHVDPALDTRYAELAAGLGWVAVEGGVARIMEAPDRAANRQIAHEMLKTLDPTYTKKPTHQAGAFVMQPSIVVGHPQGLNELQPSRKMRRNEPCFCGSNLKFKRCHGRFA